MSKYTILKLEDVPDMSGEYPGLVKMLKKPLNTEQVAISYRQLPPDTGSLRGSRRGHRHKTQEEVIVVLAGTLTMKIEDTKTEVGPWCAIRIAPGTAQDMWNDGKETVELLIISTYIENLMGDLEIIEGYWDKPQKGEPDYTIINIDEQQNILGDYPGEMMMLKDPLKTSQVAVSYRRMPKHTGSKGSYGHVHPTQEEIIFVRSGVLQVKVGDDINEIGPNSLIRIPAGAVQGSWNGEDEDVKLLIISKRIDKDDTEKREKFWD